MARRQHKISPLQILFSIVLILLAYVAPFVILIGWLVAEYRARNAGTDAAGACGHLLREIEVALSRIDEIWQDGQDRGLTLRQDNMFDARSPEGRETNSAIHAEHEHVEELQATLQGIVVPLAQRAAMRGCVMAWTAVFLFLWIRQAEPVLFWVSVWASVAAVIVASGTYYVRKAAYESPTVNLT